VFALVPFYLVLAVLLLRPVRERTEVLHAGA
jgi:hypothetical protein